jgi:GNAT superfamily N-acetyltransferase
MKDPSSTIVVEQVRPEVTYGLRASVLRPGLPPLRARFPGDDDPAALHLAAYEVTGDPALDRIVGVVAVLPEAFPDPLPRAQAQSAQSASEHAAAQPVWRLRGMAVEPGWRGRGVGRALVTRLLHDLTRTGGGLLWCNARSPAVGFYERVGFRRTGDVWSDPEHGPHLRMIREVNGPARAVGD